MRHQLQAIKGLALLFWVIIAGAGFMTSRHFAAPCTTVRDLPSQHRLDRTDLSCNCAGKAAESSGLYLNRALSQGKEVAAGVLSAVPSVKAPAGHGVVLVSIRNRADLARSVNAGSLVAVTDGGAIVTSPLTVIALVCDDTTQTTCAAAIAVPDAGKASLQAAAAKLQLIP
jgi:hypothetical protein